MAAFVALVLAACLLCGCSETSEPAKESHQSPLEFLPLKVNVKQRTTTTVAGSGGRLLLTIDDITGGQVMVSLANSEGDVVLASRSLEPRQTVDFKFHGFDYTLVLSQLDTTLVGDDRATFEILPHTHSGLTEEDRIKRLILAVKNEGAVFIRNGSEHSAAEAADHLESKWNSARDEIETAEEFIEQIGSKSSTSGDPYRIKYADGKVVDAGDFLRQKLNEIE